TGDNRMRRSRPTLELSDAKEQGYYNIGQAAASSGVSAKMIRHYEEIGLIPPADRTFSNYRIYSQADVHTLQFVRRARVLGFSMKQIQTLLGLWQQNRPSKEVKRLALDHVRELEVKIHDMQAMKRTLETLAEHCHGDHRPECPILDDLSGEPQGPGKGAH
ncbi:MAG TPA: Cu(I)-responsive transcriptional regulator, partial [Vicinamibacterales bacterium]